MIFDTKTYAKIQKNMLGRSLPHACVDHNVTFLYPKSFLLSMLHEFNLMKWINEMYLLFDDI